MFLHRQTVAVCESLCDWGETLCAASPNPTTIVTAGTSTVVCVWDIVVKKDKATHMKLRQVSFLVCLSTVTQSVFAHKKSLTQVFFIATVRSHRFSDMLGCVWSPQYDRERLPRHHLHPVGYGRAELHHSANRTHNLHLCTGYQWPHCKFTFFTTSSFQNRTHSSPLFSISAHSCHAVSFQSAHNMSKKRRSLLTAGTSSLRVFCFRLLYQLASTLNFSVSREKLRHVPDLGSTCGTWRVSCLQTPIVPTGLSLISCVSASRSNMSGIPGTSSSPAVQTASHGWSFCACVDERECVSLGSQLFIRVIDNQESLFCFYTVFHYSHYFDISFAGSNLDVHQGINNSMQVVCDCI